MADTRMVDAIHPVPNFFSSFQISIIKDGKPSICSVAVTGNHILEFLVRDCKMKFVEESICLF